MSERFKKYRFTTIVFDVDGTLLDSFESCLLLEKVFRMRYPEREVSHEVFVENFAYPMRVTLRSLGLPEDEGEDFCAYFYNIVDKKNLIFPPYPGISETVERLQADGYRLGINTSRNGQGLDRAWEALHDEVFRFFDRRLSIHSDLVKRTKPAPDSLILLCEENRLNPYEVLYIGDSDVDSQCAREAGVPFCRAMWGGHFDHVNFGDDFVLSQPAELLELLRCI